MDRYADRCSEVRHFCHTDLVPSEILDDGTLMIMEMGPGDGIAHLEAGCGVREISDGRLYETCHDFYSQFRCKHQRLHQCRDQALTAYRALGGLPRRVAASEA